MEKIEKILRKEGMKNKSDLEDDYTWKDSKADVERGVHFEVAANRQPSASKKQTKYDKERLDRIKQYIEDYDRSGKALTGRTPERIEEEDGVKKEWAFPEGAKILYVGDPWQRMGKEIDNENMTIIDYEYGDVASFITNDEYFRHEADEKAERLIDRLNYLQQGYNFSEKENLWVSELKMMLKEVDSIQRNVANSESSGYKKQYKDLAEKWKNIREYISQAYREDLEEEINEEAAEKGKGEVGDPGHYKEDDEFSRFRRDAWYASVFCERGFRDVPDWNNIILPELEKMALKEEKEQGKKLSNEERAEFFQKYAKRFIEQIRLKKETMRSNVVEGNFPELPFKDESFDRFVASWSISAHVFDISDKEDFDLYWQEIYRVLKKGGEAYIFPLDFYYNNKENMMKALEGQDILGYEFLDINGGKVEDPDYAHTLILRKNF